MDYSPERYEEKKPPISTKLFQEGNQSATVEIDLAEYLPMFKRANTSRISRNSQEYTAFQQAHRALFDYFNGMGGLNLMIALEDICLENYSQEDRIKIINSPAYELLHDSFRELLKNSVDVFLENHLKNPNDRSTKIKFNFDITTFADKISLTFSDSGAGFPREILENLENEERQLDYVRTHHRSQKRTDGTVGLLGGGAFGLRQLIHQVLTGKELKPGKKVVRATHFGSAIDFSNDSNPYCRGGSIAIVTQLAPIPDLDATANAHIEPARNSKMPHSPRPETSSSQGSRNSQSPHTTLPDAFSSSDLESIDKPANVMKLELDIDDPFLDTSSRHDQTSSGNQFSSPEDFRLQLDITDRDDSDMFAGDSPMLPKQAKQFDSFSPVVPQKQPKVSGLPKSSPLVSRSSEMPKKHSGKINPNISSSRDSTQTRNASAEMSAKLGEVQKKYKNKLSDRRAEEESQKARFSKSSTRKGKFS